MKKYRICSRIMCMFVVIVLTCDIYNFMYGNPAAFNAYPILPFNASPSYVRGVNRLCYTMDMIFDMPEYVDICMPISTLVEYSPELDSLCIHSVTQYAWKKDSLLMEVSLKDDSRRWLLASPSSLSEYICKLQEIEILDIKNFSAYHRVTLANNHLETFFNAIGLSFDTQLYINRVFAIGYLLMILSIPILNVVCLILFIKYFKEIHAEAAIYKKVFDVCALIFPCITLICLRVITHLTASF